MCAYTRKHTAVSRQPEAIHSFLHPPHVCPNLRQHAETAKTRSLRWGCHCLREGTQDHQGGRGPGHSIPAEGAPARRARWGGCAEAGRSAPAAAQRAVPRHVLGSRAVQRRCPTAGAWEAGRKTTVAMIRTTLQTALNTVRAWATRLGVHGTHE